jgi:N-acyl-L-homoserine lactone synthetase
MGSNFAYQLRANHADQVTSADHLASDDAIAAHVMRLLDRIDCRLAETDEERDAIFRLRYQAYLRSEGIAPNPSEKFSDPFDDLGDVYLFGLYDDDALASSVRIHVASKEHPLFPTGEVFPEILRPKLDAGKVMIDTTRFVADANLARLNRVLPYATLRLCGLAARHFHAEYLLAAVRVEHQAFYRRAFGHELVCGPRSYPMLNKPVCLMMAQIDQVYRRYQFLRSTFAERRLLFTRSCVVERADTASLVPTSAAPTA